MDPNETLRVLRAYAQDAQRQMDADTDEPMFCVVSNQVVSQLLMAIGNLDEWLSRGGFHPADWAPSFEVETDR